MQRKLKTTFATGQRKLRPFFFAKTLFCYCHLPPAPQAPPRAPWPPPPSAGCGAKGTFRKKRKFYAGNSDFLTIFVSKYFVSQSASVATVLHRPLPSSFLSTFKKVPPSLRLLRGWPETNLERAHADLMPKKKWWVFLLTNWEPKKKKNTVRQLLRKLSLFCYSIERTYLTGKIIPFDHVKLTWLLQLFPAAPSRAASSCKSPPQWQATPLASSWTRMAGGRPSAPDPCSSACKRTRGLRLPQVLVIKVVHLVEKKETIALWRPSNKFSLFLNFRALLKVQVRRRGAAGKLAILVEKNAVMLRNVCCFHFFQFTSMTAIVSLSNCCR